MVRRAFVLAAGLGTRLRPLTDELPKPAWPFFDVPLAAHVLQALSAAGVTEAIVNLHHLGDRLREVLRPWIPPGMEVLWSPEEEILGTGGALVPWLTRLEEGPFFLCNADTIQDLDLGGVARLHSARRALATLVVRRLPPGARAPLELGPDGRIVRFLGARAPGAPEGVPCEFTGVHLLEPDVLGQLPGGRFCINADVHVRLVAGGAPLFGFVPPDDAFWSDLGTPERYLAAHRDYLAAGRLPALSKGRLVTKDEDAAGGARILAPSYLGLRAELGRGAIVGPYTVVGEAAAVGAGARLTRSVLWGRGRIEAEEVENTVVSTSGGHLAGPDASPFTVREASPGR